MTQRIRSCSNSTNLETINCESYLTRLVNRDKVSKSKKERVLPTKNVKPSTTRTKPPLDEPAVHTNAKSDREPWNKLLKSSASTTFDQFDPLRTIHFLSKELHTKLKSDPQMLYILNTMQQALERIPPDVSASKNSIKRSKSEVRSAEDVPKKLISVNKSCQTINTLSYTDSEIFQKKLESSTAKLESSCKQMEILCEDLKNEKQYVEELLQAETNKVAHLKQQLEEVQNEKSEFSSAAFQKVVQERQELEIKLKQMKAHLSSYHGPSVQDLKGRLQDLQAQKIALEQDNITLRHKLTTADMEKERYVTLLNMRDRHINEILNEMISLQEVVSEQLVQLQKTPAFSTPSSQSTIIENYTIPSCPAVKKDDSSSEMLKNGNVMDFPLNQLYSKALKGLQSGDSSITNVLSAISQKKTKSASFFPKDNVEVAKLFNEVKMHALNLPGNRNNWPSESSTT
ncbi:hypothetical protein FQR65_LT02195 [Abscondita terminalis]|nr:hypothetical protein FQR65_LT02195 [Abscondita terminalis]